MITAARNTFLLLLLATPLQALCAQQCKPGQISATAPAARFEQRDDGTVIDKKLGLMWRTCVEGMSGKNCEDGEALTLNWAGALAYAPTFNREGGFAGHQDWRLPNIRELSSLLELQCTAPAINTAVFPNATSAGVWSSSPAKFHMHYSWYVDFDSGAFTYGERTQPKALRLVRDIQ
ncbi:Lcl C-terminal domain-containing protein [Microbulbifer thermotolerans]|uniref:Lcl C-terminal domain-containing protein n=1 Tax=Microbulbifer thermotolerans TaxID=252514 RepID=UPI002248A4B3|nr:DUF1566 domain-containing protein [Microbulbifer thermotolerans]MCX2779510.1 DUF1566 domain-containing protein [Microbulbifer thermotolerans]MCX2805680.1 DUF1566 domain-containing protein [Microbulbifer thermotolerans]MCX2830587.1 DUF1566 domain-containing protein [Microbulbifer thermotolerans]